MGKGPDAVRAALIEAAAELFANEGDVSVRMIATKAGVNHGLVHHYFGSKDGLRRAVIEHLTGLQAAALEAADPDDPVASSVAALGAARSHDRLFKILARAMLDGAPPDSFQKSFPVAKHLVKTLKEAGVDDAELRVAHGLSVSLGWMLFEPWIRAATGLPAKRSDGLLETLLAEQLAEAIR